MISDILLFIALALISIASALGMLFSKNSIYAALSLIINFGAVAVFYLILGAPFIALAQITVYAGAIMVLFLFVIMLLGAEKLHVKRTIGWQEILAFSAGVVLILQALYVIFVQPAQTLQDYSPVVDGYGSANAIGLELFNHYLLPFEVTSLLLLVAMVGAIIISRRRKKNTGELQGSSIQR